MEPNEVLPYISVSNSRSPVDEGQIIGHTDLSGKTTGPHVHYEYRPPGGSGWIDPSGHLSGANPYPYPNGCQITTCLAMAAQRRIPGWSWMEERTHDPTENEYRKSYISCFLLFCFLLFVLLFRRSRMLSRAGNGSEEMPVRQVG